VLAVFKIVRNHESVAYCYHCGQILTLTVTVVCFFLFLNVSSSSQNTIEGIKIVTDRCQSVEVAARISVAGVHFCRTYGCHLVKILAFFRILSRVLF